MANQLPEKHKGRKAEKFRGASCLNCGHPLELSDLYCSYCGQLNTTKSLSLKDFLGEFVGSVITYDSRFRYTLKDLLFKPGVITRNYVGGQRLKYANPFRFFLSVSIIYFLIQGIIGTFTDEDNVFDDSSSMRGPNFELKKDGNNFKLVRKDKDTLSLDSILQVEGIVLDSLVKNPGKPSKEELDSIIEQINPFNLKREKDEEPSYEPISEQALDSMSGFESAVERFQLYRDFYKTTKIKDPEVALDSLKHEKSSYNKWAYQKNEAFEKIEENPRDFFNYLLEKTPFFLFFFAPIYALFFWLIYSRKKYTYMEHMIFIFHIFSFVFLASIICLLPDTIIGSDIFAGILYIIIGPFYFYKALRNFYQQNRIITIIKFIFLNFVFFVSANISALIFFLITAAMY